jgi:glycosyltransferase involved in cell wall biosynthesis
VSEIQRQPDTVNETLSLSVVLPAHNELMLLGSTVLNLVMGMRHRLEHFEIIIVENGSTDGTLRLARTLAAQLSEVRVITIAKANYGSALFAGFQAARGVIVVNFDVDYYDFAFLDSATSALARQGVAIVLASKRARGARDKRPILRRLLTAAFGTVLRVGLSLRASDPHGMKVLRRELLVDIVSACRLRGSLFDVEMILRAEQNELSIVELPATVIERRPPRTSIVRRSIESLVGLLRLSLIFRSEHRAADGAIEERPTDLEKS